MAGEGGSRHRRTGPPKFRLSDIPDPRLPALYLAALAGSGALTVSLIADHHEPWWWLKATGALVAFLVLLAALIVGSVAVWRAIRRTLRGRNASR